MEIEKEPLTGTDWRGKLLQRYIEVAERRGGALKSFDSGDIEYVLCAK